jgi:hypothetical protein
MLLVPVASGPSFSIWCERVGITAPAFLTFLVALARDRPGEFRAITRRMHLMSLSGRAGSSAVCHSICADPHLWQWTAGSARVVWFYDAGGKVIISHGFVKKKARTPANERERAIDMFARYLHAKRTNAIIWE